MLSGLSGHSSNWFIRALQKSIGLSGHCTKLLVYQGIAVNICVSGHTCWFTGPHSTVCNVSGYRCEPDCKFRGPKLDPGPVPYFRGD